LVGNFPIRTELEGIKEKIMWLLYFVLVVGIASLGVQLLNLALFGREFWHESRELWRESKKFWRACRAGFPGNPESP
jgi:hypothetical protein